MLLIVDDSFELSSQKPTTAEKLARTETWSRVLFGIVPETRLRDAFDRAFRDHNSPFPVNAYEIKTAWEVIQAEELDFALKSKETDISNRIDNCKYLSQHIQTEGKEDEGFVEYVDWLNLSRFIIMPCATCRPQAYEAARVRHIQKNGGGVDDPVKPLELVQHFADHVVVPETADEILMKAQTKTRDSDVFMLLQHARNWLRYGKTQGFGEE